MNDSMDEVVMHATNMISTRCLAVKMASCDSSCVKLATYKFRSARCVNGVNTSQMASA